MADEFLVSGESLWRNLELGIADATAAGNCQRVGYLPDTFGHVGQMPQILRHFGIDKAALWRGALPAKAEFDWRAPDGSTVGALHLTQGYYQHALNVPDWQAALDRYLESVSPRSAATRLVLTQGGDHLAPHAEMAARIADYNTRQREYSLSLSTLEAHVSAALAETEGRRETLAGELRDNRETFVLPDVLSTRRYLKRLHQAAEDRLLHQLEPLAAQLKGEAPAHALARCWRRLIEQQAHDSICGCSVDAVHRDMVARFAQLDARMTALQSRLATRAGLTGATAHDAGPSVFRDERTFTVFNPLPKRFAGAVEVTLFVENAPRTVAVRTTAGATLPVTVVNRVSATRFRSPLDEFPGARQGETITLSLRADLAGLEALGCELVAGDADAPVAAPGLRRIANAFFSVELDASGGLTVTDLSGGLSIERALCIQFELDAGDTYNYSPPPDAARARVDRFAFVCARTAEDFSEMTLAIGLDRPAGLAADRKGPSATTVYCDGELTLRIFANERHVDATLVWRNAARDQRTRLCLRLPSPISHMVADSAFDWVRRPVRLAAYPAAPSRQEMPVAVNPSLAALAAGPWRVAHRALQEFEIVEDAGEHFVGLTLVRSVGWMSRRDLVTRGVGAGPDMATPDAQCLGEEVFTLRFALGGEETDALALAEGLRRAPFALPGVADAWHSPATLAHDPVQVSAVRAVGDTLEVRLWNPTDAPQPLTVPAAEGWRRVRADGSDEPGDLTHIAPRAILSVRRPRQ